MLALAQYRQSRCTHCGGDMDETTDPASEDAYEHLPPIQCHRCVALERARAAYEDQPHPFTFMHLVRRVRRR
jgi:NAD-dependent SIR2 family protein deacetylase